MRRTHLVATLALMIAGCSEVPRRVERRRSACRVIAVHQSRRGRDLRLHIEEGKASRATCETFLDRA